MKGTAAPSAAGDCMMEPKKLIGMVIAAVLLIVALTLVGQVLTLMPQV